MCKSPQDAIAKRIRPHLPDLSRSTTILESVAQQRASYGPPSNGSNFPTMNPTKSLAGLRPVSRLTSATSIRPFLSARPYATQGSTNNNSKPTSRRRSVTPFNDTGFVPWSELSVSEKAARATQQSFNFGMVIVGIVLTVSHLVSSQIFRALVSDY
jgi:import inner membrane translocase subunit TIM21